MGSFRKNSVRALIACALAAFEGAHLVIIDECVPMVAVNSATCGALPRNPPPTHSTLACLQMDPDFAGFIISELNAGLFKDFLYLEDGGEVSFHHSFILLDPLEGRQPNAGGAGKLTLAPA